VSVVPAVRGDMSVFAVSICSVVSFLWQTVVCLFTRVSVVSH
jgi:hypothetical protein